MEIPYLTPLSPFIRLWMNYTKMKKRGVWRNFYSNRESVMSRKFSLIFAKHLKQITIILHITMSFGPMRLWEFSETGCQQIDKNNNYSKKSRRKHWWNSNKILPWAITQCSISQVWEFKMIIVTSGSKTRHSYIPTSAICYRQTKLTFLSNFCSTNCWNISSKFTELLLSKVPTYFFCAIMQQPQSILSNWRVKLVKMTISN